MLPFIRLIHPDWEYSEAIVDSIDVSDPDVDPEGY